MAICEHLRFSALAATVGLETSPHEEACGFTVEDSHEPHNICSPILTMEYIPRVYKKDRTPIMRAAELQTQLKAFWSLSLLA